MNRSPESTKQQSTSALHNSKVMFSCCLPGLRQKFVYIKHMRLHDFLDLPTVVLARSENTKRDLKIVLG